MSEKVTCPICGETREIYDAYRECPWFNQKVDAIARMEDTEPRRILSTGRWEMPIPDEMLGLID